MKEAEQYITYIEDQNAGERERKTNTSMHPQYTFQSKQAALT